MVILIDAQLSPALALWINSNFTELRAQSVRSLGLRDAKDKEIFLKAKELNAVIMSKDDDFRLLLERFGTPPQIIWISCGNTSNKKMREILGRHLQKVVQLLNEGNELVEISDK